MPVPKPPRSWLSPPDFWRVLVVEDQPVVGEWIAQVLNGQPDFEVCKNVPTADLAMKAIVEMKPDVVTTGIEMPGMWPKLRVLVLSLILNTCMANAPCGPELGAI